MANRLTRGRALVGSLASDVNITLATMGTTASDVTTKAYVDARAGNTIVASAPRTITTATDTTVDTDKNLIANNAGTVTLTLPVPANYIGRQLILKTITANTVVSATANVVPQAGGAAGTAILAATAGKWAEFISDGTNWVIMRSN